MDYLFPFLICLFSFFLGYVVSAKSLKVKDRQWLLQKLKELGEDDSTNSEEDKSEDVDDKKSGTVLSTEKKILKVKQDLRDATIVCFDRAIERNFFSFQWVIPPSLCKLPRETMQREIAKIVKDYNKQNSSVLFVSVNNLKFGDKPGTFILTGSIEVY